MPCDSIILNRVELPAMNPELLRRALQALGAVGVGTYAGAVYFTLEGERCRIEGGKLVVREGAEGIADRLKRAYSAEVVKYTAKKNGWELTEVRPFVYAIAK